MVTRAWLILRVKKTKKVIVLQRSKHSRNKGQWDFIGGSSNKRKVNPRKLIWKEYIEEIGFNPSYLQKDLVIVTKRSIYHYFSSTINEKQLESLELSKEHKDLKVVNINKLENIEKLHHSIKMFLKYR